MPWVAWALSEEGTPLPRHPDARLTPRGRAPPCERVGGGTRVSDAGAMAGAGTPGSRSTSTPGRWRAYPGGGGHGALGRGRGSRRGAGTSFPRVAVDDNGRVAHDGRPPDERKGTARALMGRAIASCGGLGVAVGRVAADDGPACRSGGLGAPPGARGMGHGHARPFGPWQKGKAGRMNRTLAQEWQYARARESEGARASALAPFLEHYNRNRPHGACGGLPSMSRITGANNVLAHNTYRGALL